MNSIQIGLDLATSISVIVAAITFVIQQQRNRNQAQKLYAVGKLDGFLAFLKDSNKDWDELGNELRRAGVAREAEIEKDPSIANTMLDEHFLEVILFVEGVQRELRSQIRTYFPIFISASVPAEITGFDSALEGLLATLRDPDRRVRASALGAVKATLGELTDAFARELLKLIRH